jgi:transposase
LPLASHTIQCESPSLLRVRVLKDRVLFQFSGLVPGERSSAETIRRGGITKTGHAHARRALVEGAWAYRMKARIGRHKVDRIEALPKKSFATSGGKRKFGSALDIGG